MGRGPSSSYQRFGPYVLLERLAAGGMGELFLAHKRGIEGFQKLLAIKRILPNVSEHTEFVQMFLNEARLAATLEHPNVVRVYDLGREDGSYYIAMEYLHGATLGELLVDAARADRLIPTQHALTIVSGVALGLHYAHNKEGIDGRALGIVHRDVSPNNVIITVDGTVKVVDFGIAKARHATAKITQGDAIKGKVSYMSPEQVRGEALDHRSDIFAIGILLYELTTGRRAFRGENQFSVMNAVAAGAIAPPSRLVADYPPQLEAIVTRALAREAADRYDSALELHRDLEALAASRHLSLSPVALAEYIRETLGDREYPSVPTESPDLAAPMPEPGSRRNRGRTLVGVAGGLLGGLGLAAWLGSGSAETPPAPPAPAPEPTPVQPAKPAVAADRRVPAKPKDEPAGVPPAATPTEPPPPQKSKRKRKSKPRKAKPLRGIDGMLPER